MLCIRECLISFVSITAVCCCIHVCSGNGPREAAALSVKGRKLQS